MAVVPNYSNTPKIGIAQIATANLLRDGTGTLGTVFTAGANGSRIDTIEVQATAVVTAGMVRLFIYDGTAARLFAELPVTAQTPSGTATAWSATFTSQSGNLAGATVMPIVLPTGYSLRAATNNAEAFNVIAFGGDF